MSFELASMRGHDPLHDREAKASTIVACMVSAAVASRQLAKTIWCQARPVVGNTHD